MIHFFSKYTTWTPEPGDILPFRRIKKHKNPPHFLILLFIIISKGDFLNLIN